MWTGCKKKSTLYFMFVIQRHVLVLPRGQWCLTVGIKQQIRESYLLHEINMVDTLESWIQSLRFHPLYSFSQSTFYNVDQCDINDTSCCFKTHWFLYPIPTLARLKSPPLHSGTYMCLYGPYIAVPLTPCGDQPHQHLCRLIIHT